MLHTARNTCCWASFQKGLVWCFPKNLSRSNVKCLKALREVFTSLASARRNWRAHVKSFQVILIQQQTGCFFFFFHTRAHKLWKKKRNALISRILDFWKMYGNRVTNSSGAVFYGGHTSDRYFMWWLFFHHLSEIKWIFHLSEIIVRYRKDFSQNKRGQSEHRITGEVKPTVFFFFFQLQICIYRWFTRSFSPSKAVVSYPSLPTLQMYFYGEVFTAPKICHPRTQTPASPVEKKPERLLTVSLWKSKSAQRGRDSHDGFTPTFWPAAAFFSNTSLYFFSSYICEANKFLKKTQKNTQSCPHRVPIFEGRREKKKR